MSKRARQTRKSEMGGESKMSKASAATTIALAIGSLFIAGCATKEYVRQAITPIDKKGDQVDQSSQKRDSGTVCGNHEITSYWVGYALSATISRLVLLIKAQFTP